MLVVLILGQTCDEAENFADEQCDLDQAAGSVGEAVICRVDLGYTLCRDEDETKCETRPERKEEDDRLGYQEMYGASDRFE